MQRARQLTANQKSGVPIRTQKTGIQNLTYTLLLDIFRYLRTVKNLAICSLVCREWHTITWAYALEMDLSSFQNGTNRVIPVNDSKIIYLSVLCPSVRVLNLNHCPALTDNGMSAVTHLTNLRKLSLQGCKGLTDSSLLHLSKSSRLEHLNIAGLAAFSPAALKTLSRLSSLQSLCLRSLDSVDDRVLSKLCQLPKLEALDISSCVNVTAEGTKYFNHKTSLRMLNLSGNSRLGQQRAWNQFSDVPNLECLKLKSVIFSDDQMDDFVKVMINFTKLVELRLGFCQIRDSHCDHFTKLKNLKSLSIHNVFNLSAESFSHLQNLTELDLSRSQVPPHALEHLSNLVKLQLKNSTICSIKEKRSDITKQNLALRQKANQLSGSNESSHSSSNPILITGRGHQFPPRGLTWFGSPVSPPSYSFSDQTPPSTSFLRVDSAGSSWDSESSSVLLDHNLPNSLVFDSIGFNSILSNGTYNDLARSSSSAEHDRTEDDIYSPTNRLRKTEENRSSPNSKRRLSGSIKTKSSSPELRASSSRHWQMATSSQAATEQSTKQPDQIVEFRSLQHLRTISTLRKLCIRIEKLSDRDLGHISRCRKLRELDLLWLSSATHKGLCKLQRLQMLQKLNLTNCKTLTNEGLREILPCMKQLKELSLARCVLISDPGILVIASNLHELRFLVLYQLSKITTEAVISLVALEYLEVLDVSGCKQIDFQFCENYMKTYLPILHLNHEFITPSSTNASKHCVIS